jgi:hypothetical protein
MTLMGDQFGRIQGFSAPRPDDKIGLMVANGLT